jgi:hypothetical protein
VATSCWPGPPTPGLTPFLPTELAPLARVRWQRGAASDATAPVLGFSHCYHRRICADLGRTESASDEPSRRVLLRGFAANRLDREILIVQLLAQRAGESEPHSECQQIGHSGVIVHCPTPPGNDPRAAHDPEGKKRGSPCQNVLFDLGTLADASLK